MKEGLRAIENDLEGNVKIFFRKIRRANEKKGSGETTGKKGILG
jgi:hypothetical protein